MLYIISYKKKKANRSFIEMNLMILRQDNIMLFSKIWVPIAWTLYILYKSSNAIFIAINKKILINLDWKNKKTFDEKIIGFCF